MRRRGSTATVPERSTRRSSPRRVRPPVASSRRRAPRHQPMRTARSGMRSLTGLVPAKVALSAALVMISAALVGVGTFATFTDTAAVSVAHTSGTLTLAPINASGANNRLSIGATDIAAGDTIDRAVNVKNTGTLNLASVVLTSTATVSSLLDTDATNGLQMVIDKCSVAWTEGGTAPAYTYTCGGSTTSVLTTRAVIGTNLSLSNITTTAGADNFLRVRLTLPSSAPNTLQGQSSTISYAFTATQRAATSK